MLAIGRFFIAVLWMFAARAYAQKQTPNMLLHAAQCLAAKDFLAPSKTTALSFGYLLDATSYPGEKVIYVVHYTEGSQGEAFTVFLTERRGQQVFNIQNNATFLRVNGSVEFTGEPLGGIWTH